MCASAIISAGGHTYTHPAEKNGHFQAAGDGGTSLQVDERGARLAVPVVCARPDFRPSLLLHGTAKATDPLCICCLHGDEPKGPLICVRE